MTVRGGKENELRNGKWKEFNKHAILISEGNYVNDVKDGVWREYDDSTGVLTIEESYANGVQHGKFAAYHLNGKLLSEGEYRFGLREGYFRIYDESGVNVRNILFINDIEIEDTEGNGSFCRARVVSRA